MSRRTLRYWKCKNLDETGSSPDAYSIRAKTKAEAQSLREEYGAERFTKPYKVELVHYGIFDLAFALLSPGRGRHDEGAEDKNIVWPEDE